MYQIHRIAAFNDNYIWLVQYNSSHAYVVDPGCGQTVIDYLAANKIQLSGIFITHHHHDHTGGIALLQNYHQDKLTVFGPYNESIVGLTQQIKLAEHQTDTLHIKDWHADIKVVSVLGHTRGHIAYIIDDNLFCGDTLFSGGCGRLFEGTAKQMSTSLSVLAKLPDATKVFCAHEYTQSNLTFAVVVMPDNKFLKNYLAEVNTLRKDNQATIPTNMGLEKRINPFLQCENLAIKSAVSLYSNEDVNDEIQVFKNLRLWKDNF
ncbi:hydroxyacylglutathione hydrolase [Shewanella sp. OMA3-2]|uniref:hydroxyacylglutathione hydrolase n=1 Tax=Shewanella sp. OMA3-2 TaxID=2908650 RepID=UPI001F3E8613|nr:hydroxyacylglutathione hydrolase [Shewanella sp. OMA3-2]UJF23541.1 hydroxyacylglutathione hydrolase [Shewanella sp. OMA3-2]